MNVKSDWAYFHFRSEKHFCHYFFVNENISYSYQKGEQTGFFVGLETHGSLTLQKCLVGSRKTVMIFRLDVVSMMLFWFSYRLVGLVCGGRDPGGGRGIPGTIGLVLLFIVGSLCGQFYVLGGVAKEVGSEEKLGKFYGVKLEKNWANFQTK